MVEWNRSTKAVKHSLRVRYKVRETFSRFILCRFCQSCPFSLVGSRCLTYNTSSYWRSKRQTPILFTPGMWDMTKWRRARTGLREVGRYRDAAGKMLFRPIMHKYGLYPNPHPVNSYNLHTKHILSCCCKGSVVLNLRNCNAIINNRRNITCKS